MKNLKRFMAYFLWILLVGCFIVWAKLYKIVLNNEMNPMILLFVMLLPIFIGLLLALPRFVSVILKPGVWTFDWAKFIAVGLPSFLVAGAMSIFWVIPFLHKYMPFLYNNSILTTTGGIVFGYVLLTSFEKVTPRSSTLSEADNVVPLQ